ncbi:LysR family transcriptional regulator [Actinocrispum wychmicini]|uniref:DNA-binding transcriptional LysR family regulator n=1 Tax=Actinocrispum wychmicini TaxID=1213861 RepID=A0A4R2JIK8_9PSEU|nr:LysR family transcriptional regulator [Actinocrispum wychmicini]TCO58597.1 DNA-binding transcriptional LysR family regulator [Actinocrispum wychmicini]
MEFIRPIRHYRVIDTPAYEWLATAIAPRLAMLRALAVEGNVTRAAERLGVPQPTISRWLAALGEEVGAPLVVKDGRGIRLTRAGHLLVNAATASMGALEAGTRRVAEEVDPNSGRVVLGFLHMLGRSLVPELVRAFRTGHPRVRFGLVQSSRDEVLARLRAGEVDLAFFGPPPDDPAVRWAPMRHQELMLTLPETHRLAGRSRVRIAELAGEEFVGLEHGFGLRQITDDLFATAGFIPRMAFEGQEIDTVRGLVSAGLGVALLPVTDQPIPGLVEIPVTPKAGRLVALAWPAHNQMAPAVRAFRDYALLNGPDQVS